MVSIAAVLERFEEAWTSSQLPSVPPSIAEYVDAIGTSDAAARMRLLIELICIDMEYRWKRLRQGTQERRLDDYHIAFPELGELRHTPMVLIEEEYRTRQQWGDRPSHSIYVKRFGERSGAVEKALQRIDDEIRRESSCPSKIDRLKPRAIRMPSLPTFAYSDLLLEEMIGFGHMGRVYRATHKITGQTVAVKFLRKVFCRNEGAVNRFLREADMVYGLKNPGIVPSGWRRRNTQRRSFPRHGTVTRPRSVVGDRP